MASLQRGRAISDSLLNKQILDTKIMSPEARETWYDVDFRHFKSDKVKSTFGRSNYDNETDEFLVESKGISDSICLQLYYSFAATILGVAMTKTSINGLLNRGAMFLFSKENLDVLFGDQEITVNTIIDLGAGDGAITSVITKYFASKLKAQNDRIQPSQNDFDVVKTYATEASLPMRYRLKMRGIKVFGDLDMQWQLSNELPNGIKSDLICVLNLLDRHPKPMTLLRDLWKKAMADEALILMGVVLPWSQFTEFSAAGPEERITIYSKSNYCVPGENWTFDSQVCHFYHQILEPIGFELVKWTKLPYLCEGDAVQAYYHLNDAVFLLKPVEKV